MKINIKKLSFFQFTQFMTLSRNRKVNLDKMSAWHEGHEGSTECNVGHEGFVDSQEVYQLRRSKSVYGGL